MAGDLAVDGGLEQFLEYLKTKMGIRRPQEEGTAQIIKTTDVIFLIS